MDRSLSSLQSEVENFILRMAAEFPDRKQQLVFLINNYDMMLAVLTVREREEGRERERERVKRERERKLKKEKERDTQ